MTWEKLPPLERPGYRSGCLNCGPQLVRLKMNALCATGFGQVVVTKDGKEVWSGDDERVTLMRFENRARKDPDHDWRITYFGPLSEPEYQRHGRNKWVLVRKGLGFA